MLTQDNLIGMWAGLPVAWNDNDTLDEAAYREDVVRCCKAKVHGLYTGGTTGEFYAMDFEEFKTITDITIDEAKKGGISTQIGCSDTYTRGVIRKVTYAAKKQADGIQVTLPFWLALRDDEVIQFFKDIASAVPGMPIIHYNTLRAKRILDVKMYQRIKDEVPELIGVKWSGQDTIDTICDI
ncbi:MAG: dihydrodipicolinate synthase family protein, partial [Candidatus Omnitrophica bacterium]|nr:dihydrodipicolinate synthase family protein [Candidatus Omnitrophota bacterium]